MSIFIPRIKVTEEPAGLVVKDVSGMRSSDNPGGYGGTNISADQVTGAVLYVTPVTDAIPESSPINVFSVMGENDGIGQVLPWDIVSGWKVIESEKYKIRYVVTATGDDGVSREYETYVYFVATLQAECCVDKLTGKTSNVKFDSLFKDECSRTEAILSVLLRRAKAAIGCSNFDAAETQITHVRFNCNCNCH